MINNFDSNQICMIYYLSKYIDNIVMACRHYPIIVAAICDSRIPILFTRFKNRSFNIWSL